MLPNPLHPAIVHFPIVLVILLPFFAIGALWAIRRGASARKTWLIPTAVAAALTVSAFVSLRTGQAQGEKVERVVPEKVVDAHEEAAERFLVLSGVLLAVVGAGLAGGVVGRSARLVSTVGALGLVVAGVQVGASGGDLVYKHGAASIYARAPGGAVSSAMEGPAVATRERVGDDD